MRRYCLTYDAKDYQAIYIATLKIDIAKALISIGAKNLISPSGSTIIFEENTDKYDITVWDELLQEHFGDKIYYYLCLVAQTKNAAFIDKTYAKESLIKDFNEYIKKL